MADFKIDRIRYRWKGDWTSTIEYIPDDVISYQGKVYFCLVRHTADADFYTDLNFLNSNIPPAPEPRWELMMEGQVWLGDWTVDTFYAIGSIVKYNGIIYICTDEHTSAITVEGFATDLANWDIYIQAENWREDWTISTYYATNDIVKYSGIVFRCLISHTSASTLSAGLEVDLSAGKWEIVAYGIKWYGDWTVSIRYHINDIVRYGGIVYRCIIEHTSASTAASGLEADSSSWTEVHVGLEYKNTWASAVRYKLKDIVKYGAGLYSCILEHTSTSTFVDGNWELYVPGFEYENQWNSGTRYQPGDVVRYGGYQYVSKTNHVNQTPSLEADDWTILHIGTRVRGEWDVETVYLVGDLVRREAQLYVAIADSSGQETTVTAYWELVVPGEKWQGVWATGRTYLIGDLINLGATAHRCLLKHISSVNNRPDNDYENNYWTIHVIGSQTNVLNTVGDIKTYGVTEDGSSIGPTRLGIGNSGDVLKVVDGNPVWEPLWESAKVYYVGTDGVDDANHGTTLNAPWRTIRYACENITGYATIYVKHGTYYEVLPIRVPAFVGIVGDELRGTVVSPAPTLIPSTDKAKTIEAIDYMKTIVDDVVQALVVSTLYSNVDQDTSAPGCDDTAKNDVVDIFTDIIDELNQVSLPTISGTNSVTGNAEKLKARQQLINNKNFLIQESVAYIEDQYPLYTFNTETCIRDLGLFIDSVVYDTYYPGNWKSVEAARYYLNAADGVRNAKQNMFLLRNGTGLRNMTLKGLAGNFTSPDQYTIKRVDGGAFASLDPGWGPNDSTAWITNKSPYVQNVTTFGTKCVGLKVDGGLHSSGTKSIVANDFTQVLDDGIGAWIVEEGKSELVSVFTYYNYIGYLSENGGKIRATNGNNSYGTYGSVAIATNSNEIPITCTLNNRYYEAQIASTFCIAGNISKLLFSNAGVNYTQANFSVAGSGVNAALTGNELRDGAVFEARIVDRGDSSLLGGLGYSFNIGQSQQGDTEIIRLAAQNTATNAQYAGLRVFLQSGTGAGQYGYIAELDTVSKDVYIAKENLPTINITATTISTNYITVANVDNLAVNTKVVLTGSAFGGLLNKTIYYIESIVDGTTITLKDISSVQVSVSTTTGLMVLNFSGWDHIVPGAAIESTLDTSTQYYIEPRVTFSEPSFSSSAGTLPNSVNWSSVASSGSLFVAIGNGNNVAAGSSGTSWTPGSISSQNWTSVAYGDGQFVAVANGGTTAAYSVNGLSWTTVTIPENNYTSVIYGDYADVWVAVAQGQDKGARSTDGGLTWSQVTLPDGADWNSVAYGNGKFVAVAKSDSTVTQTAYSTDGQTWSSGSFVGGAESVVFGNGRFVAIEGTTSNVAFYSLDGINWTATTLPGSATLDWKVLAYGGGTFLAMATGSSQAATSYDGVTWTSRTVGSGPWAAATYGAGKFVAIGGYISPSSTALEILTGARTQGRATVVDAKVSAIDIWEPGSGYTADPTITLTDPSNTADVAIDVRVGNGVIANPTLSNAGTGYFSISTDITITGDGYQDLYQIGKDIIVENLTREPRPGDNLFFDSITDYTYRVLVVTILSGSAPNLTARLTIAKALGRAEAPEHGETIDIRQKYSQVRITGHDFLDIGLGNFTQTNYPNTLFPNGTVLAPEFEFAEVGSGRVFYTSTDQDGNFRVGELFAVEQSTGTVTLSADFFTLEGLEEVQLGGISAGGTGAVIREFSTDKQFTADSNNIVSTQRAIKAYVANRVSGGGSDAKTGIALSGIIQIGGPDIITTTTLTQIDIPVKMNFKGGVDGDLLALSFFYDAFMGDHSSDRDFNAAGGGTFD